MYINYPASINTLRPRQNGRHFADDTFKRIFLNESVGILINISLKLVPKGPINNSATLVQMMAWRRSGDKPLSDPMMVKLSTHIYVTRPQIINVSKGSYEEPFQKHSYKTLTLKCRHADQNFVTCCTKMCHFDNFCCNQWRTFRQHDIRCNAKFDLTLNMKKMVITKKNIALKWYDKNIVFIRYMQVNIKPGVKPKGWHCLWSRISPVERYPQRSWTLCNDTKEDCTVHAYRDTSVSMGQIEFIPRLT